MGAGDDRGTGWKAIAKVAGIVLVVIALLGALPYAAERLAAQGQIPWWAGPVGIVLGLLAFYGGFKTYRERQLVRDTPTSKVRSLAIGTAEIQGRAEALTEPLVSPLTHTPACMYELKVQEQRVVKKTENGRTKRKREWRTVLRIRDDIPFCIDDGTGRIPVRADEAELDFAREARINVGKGDAPPEKLQTWAAEHGPSQEDIKLPGPLGDMVEEIQRKGKDPSEMDPAEFHPEGFDPESDDPSELDPEDVKLASILYGEGHEQDSKVVTDDDGGGSGSLFETVKSIARAGEEFVESASQMSGQRYMTRSTRNKRRFEEWVLGAGEEAYVFGSARRLPEADSIRNVENLVMREDPTTGHFLVSDKSIQRLLDEKLVRSVLGLGAAAVLLPYSIMGLAVWAGLV